jgi:hypothetical protein
MLRDGDALTNDYTVRLRGLDRLYVGDPFGVPPGSGGTWGLKWDIQGDSPPLGDAEVGQLSMTPP